MGFFDWLSGTLLRSPELDESDDRHVVAINDDIAFCEEILSRPVQADGTIIVTKEEDARFRSIRKGVRS